MMMHRTSILSMTSLAIALLFASFVHVETARLRRAIRAIEFESPAPKLEVKPPSKSASGTTAAKVGRRRRGLGATSTTTATAKSITTTTTMMSEDDEMSPSDFYQLHHREHGLALVEEAAAEAAAAEEDYDEERDPRQQWRRRRRRRRELVQIVERPHLDQQQPPEEEEEDDQAATELQQHEKEQVNAVADIVYDEEGERDPQRRRERQALKALYDATNGDGWDDWAKGQWLNDTVDHCYWDTRRIECTGGDGYVWWIEGYVWWIDLSRNNLNGTLPTEIGDLVHLEVLGLKDNKHLSGTIPASIGQLTELTALGVSGTSLNGPVPANVMTLIFGTPGRYFSPDNTDDYPQLSPLNCMDVVGWANADGDGCDSYANDTSSCATDGAPLGDMGHAADTACCACGVWGPYNREREVLQELYGATNGGGWRDNSSWANSSTSHCYYWTGVRCNSDGMVTNITLPSNNLHGSIPTSIGELRSLQILDVSNNDIIGGIPTEVYTLSNLEGLHLRNVSLGGTVPVTQLASLSLLRRLDLGHNGLTGPIPVAITDMSLIEDLRLSHNRLTGAISPEFRRMSRLKRLDLENNRLEGSIPIDIGLLGLLRELRISNQETYPDSSGNWHFLSGPIPVELGDCQYLEVLDLSDNRLTGSLPTELARLARLKSLLLHDNNFEGRIPSEYGLLPSLENLTLGLYDWKTENKIKPAPLSLCFDGAFDLHSDPSWCPPERNALKRLYDATGGDGWSNSANWTDPYGDHCSWYGVGCDVRVSCRDVQNWTDSGGDGCDWYDPDNCKEYGDSLENDNHTANTACCVCQQEKLGCFMIGTECIEDYVTRLSLNTNGLSGSLPAELGQLTQLERVNLSDNALVGGLPYNIVDLTNLRLLDLTGNTLSGGFPEEITNLPLLTEALLSRNELSGELSIRASANPSNLTFLHFANNKFGGELSAAFTQLHSLPHLREIDMSYNSFHGSMPSTPIDGITKLTVGGNERMTAPIPSSLCHKRTLDLDLKDSPVHCPVLSFLHLFNDSTNGTSWNWDDVAGICDESSWNGIKCDETNTSTVTINLTHHGLSGTLPDSLGEHMAALSFLRVLDLSNNDLSGLIPLDLARLSLLEEVRLANNRFSGTLPAQISNLPRLKILDVATNQLTGALPIEYGRLSSLRELRLSGNHFGESSVSAESSIAQIPVEWGDLANLEHMDLSQNSLTGEIPGELGKLSRLSQLHLHNNRLNSSIPTELGQLLAIENLTLSGNVGLEPLAPLSVCALSIKMDLHSDHIYCPPERGALKALYEAMNGDSWANRTNWLNEYEPPCNHTKQWFGISCVNETTIVSIDLSGNSLYGTLPSEVFELRHLQELRLGENRLYGTLPARINGNRNLQLLQLSGNDFSGQIPSSITSLTNLALLHLHGNRFTTDVPIGVTASNITADCGDPYYYGDRKVSCEDCNICCNSEGKCMEQVKEPLGLPQKTGLFMGCMIAFLLIFCAIVFTLNNFVDLPLPKRSAMDYCGESSVYSFFLAKSCRGWILTFATVAAQVGIFTMFLSAANIDNENSDWEYYMRCPPNQLWCESDDTVDYKGWLIFGLLMVAFLGKDVISGIMLMYAAGLRTNFFCFVSGSFISVVTGYAVWTSVQYNLAIATSNTALVSNAVIILFVNDLDERMFALSGWLFPGWVAGVTQKSNVRSADICFECSTTQELIGNTSKIADMGSAADEQSDKEGETSVSCGEDLHALFTKQNETIEELRAQIKALKTAFELQTSNGKLKRKLSENPESTSDDDD